jgi:ADP-ribosylglycohydrolase/sugar/nucleoside kinase (ribokinase family)
VLDRAIGAMVGLALGDALGMPTQSFPRRVIAERWGVVPGLEPGPPDQPLAPGLPAGRVTDDTEQAVLLARLLVAGGGHVDPVEFAHRLLAWEDTMRARGSLDLLGPSTKGALVRLLDGVPPTESGLEGTTNGAAMRVTPVGLVHRAGPGLIDAVVAASQVTHYTSVALAGAAAVAAAVSAGIDGASVADAVEAAIGAAEVAAARGRWVAAGDVAARIRYLSDHPVTWATHDELLDRVGALVGTSLATQESVPASFALILAAGDDPWLALRLAASIGGDCDTIAAMAGAVLGACHGPAAFPAAAIAQVETVNGLDLGALARQLVDLRLGQGEEALGCLGGRPRDRAATGEAGPDRVLGQRRERHVPPAPFPGPAGRLIYTGQAVVDLVLAVPHLPERGGDVIGDRAQAVPGGGFNVMAAAARQGLPVVYAGAHGVGPHGDLVRSALRAEGIAIAQAPWTDRDTGWALALIEPDGERTLAWAPGAETHLDPADLEDIALTSGDFVYVNGYALTQPAKRAALRQWLPEVAEAQATLVFDPGPLAADLPPAALDAVLDRADWISANEAEALQLTGLFDVVASATQLGQRAGHGAVVRLGAAGCLVAERSAGTGPLLTEVRGFAVDAVDLNGAGDAHVGVFIAALAQGSRAKAAAERANAAAALTVTGRGPATAPSAAAVDAFLQARRASSLN